MNIPHLEEFVIHFFTAYRCNVLKHDEGQIHIQLTEEMDKALMNRPFYWQYMQNIGERGQPHILRLITDPEKREQKGEWIHFGSPRLQQIQKFLTQNEKYMLLFEEVKTTKNTPLYPWLLANMKISYKGKQKKEELISLGIQLINGKIVVNMMEELNKRTLLKQQIPDYCYTISPIITIKSGYLRMESLILNYIEKLPMQWAEEARAALEDEIKLLKHFYSGHQKDDLLQKEMKELKNRYEPEISIEVINGGLIYLSSRF